MNGQYIILYYEYEIRKKHFKVKKTQQQRSLDAITAKKFCEGYNNKHHVLFF